MLVVSADTRRLLLSQRRARVSELRIIALVLLIFGLIGVFMQGWFHLAPRFFYRIDSTQITSVAPGMIKFRLDREVRSMMTISVTAELHCLIEGTDTVTPLWSKEARVAEPGQGTFDTNFEIPASAFDGQETGLCYLSGINEFQPYSFLPSLDAAWQSQVVEAQRPISARVR